VPADSGQHGADRPQHEGPAKFVGERLCLKGGRTHIGRGVYFHRPGLFVELERRAGACPGVTGDDDGPEDVVGDQVIQCLREHHEALCKHRLGGRDFSEGDECRLLLNLGCEPFEGTDGDHTAGTVHDVLVDRFRWPQDGGQPGGAGTFQFFVDGQLYGVARIGLLVRVVLQRRQRQLADLVELEMSPDQRVGRTLRQWRVNVQIACTVFQGGLIGVEVIAVRTACLAQAQRLETQRQLVGDPPGLLACLVNWPRSELLFALLHRPRTGDVPGAAGEADGQRRQQSRHARALVAGSHGSPQA